ncbi:hypothetical protein HO498_04530 [Streptococcus suis]|nr:hypothetical protein [Streptococcus suis]
MKLFIRFIIAKWKNIFTYILLNLCLMTIIFQILSILIAVHESINFNPNSGLNLYSLEIDSRIINNTELDLQPVSKRLLTELGKSKYVKNYDIFLSEEIYSSTLKNIDYLEEPKVGVFNLRGTSSNFLIDEYLNKINIVQGIGPSDPEFYKTKNAVIINKSVAELNNITLGEEINNQFYVDLGLETEGKFNFGFKVVGIYDFYSNEALEHLIGDGDDISPTHEPDHAHNHESHTVEEKIVQLNEKIQNYRFNILYSSNQTVLDFLSEHSKYSVNNTIIPFYQATFELFNDNLEDNFNELASKKIKAPYVIKSNTDEYREHIKPLNSLFITLVAILMVLIIIMIVLNVGYLRINKKKFYEIKILYNIGNSTEAIYNFVKYKFCFLNITLVLIASILGYSISRTFFVSNLIGKILDNSSFMLETTGTNLELMITTPYSSNFKVMDYFNLNFQFLIYTVLILLIINYSFSIILKNYIKMIGEYDGNFNNKKCATLR